MTESFKSDRSIVTGNFDGLHRGHRFLFMSLLEIARERKQQPLVVSFFPHPREVLPSRDAPEILTTPAEKKRILLEEFGLPLETLDFTLEFAQMSAEEYAVKVLIEQYGMKTWVMGPDHRFGRDGAGSSKRFQEILQKYGVELAVLPEMKDLGGGIRSTWIRQLLKEGEIKQANRLLGRPYLLLGKVIQGDKIGREIGFPTANLKFSKKNKCLPKFGVYGGIVEINEKTHIAAIFIGKRLTIDALEQRCEVHILDYDENLYGQELVVKLYLRVRSEQKFSNREELCSQIEKDIVVIRKNLKT